MIGRVEACEAADEGLTVEGWGKGKKVISRWRKLTGLFPWNIRFAIKNYRHLFPGGFSTFSNRAVPKPPPPPIDEQILRDTERKTQ